MPLSTEPIPGWIPVVHGNPVAALGASALFLWDTGAAGTAKKRWMWDSLKLLREGYSKFYGRPWQVWTSEGHQVVLPPNYIDELKMLPDHTLPSPHPSWKLDYVNHVILHHLNKNMAKIFPAINKGVDTAISIELPTSTDWVETDILTKLARLVCRVSAIAFVGPEIQGNEEWIDIGCNYTKDGFLAALKLRAIPAFLRPLAAPLIPDLRRVYRHNDRARSLIQEIIQKREGATEAVLKYDKPNDTVQWIYDMIPDEDKKNYSLQGALQLAVTAVSVQSTSKMIGNVILNLMKYEEYVPILKQEIQTTLAECGGVWTLESMGKLEKLDSFMRETMRYEPPLTATFQRHVKKPVKLSDGTTLPKETLVFTPSDAVAFDPNFYPDPEKFDGLRFFKLRREAEENGEPATARVRHQFVATSKTAVQFGLGRHACPGRWFAGHVIKMVVAAVLLRYDLKFRAGEGKRKTFLFQTTNMPDPKTRILIRKKEELEE
ncbi:cytochrome P450 [Colletotrichum somersetense]|nr:cytochrome P450 [Colletotrichum somersetense]